MMTLPDKTNRAAAILRKFGFIQRFQRTCAEVYCTVRWSVQRSQDVEQSTFAGAGRSDNRNHFAAIDCKADSIEWGDFLRPGVVALSQAFDAHKLPGACGGSELSVVNDSDAQGSLPLHCEIYVTLDAELPIWYVLHLQATSDSQTGTIL